MEKILTVPSPVAEETVFATGNHHVSASHITSDGWVNAVSHLSQTGGALVEHTGSPLIRLLYNGSPLKAEHSCYRHHFIPSFTAKAGGAEIRWEFAAPEGIRGFVVRVCLSAGQRQTAEVMLEYTPGQLMRSLFHSRPLHAQAEFAVDSWTGAATAEYAAGFGVSAVAISGDKGFDARGQQGRLCVAQQAEIAPDGETVMEFYVAYGAEQDGASLANMDMRRRGRRLYQDQKALLENRACRIPDPVLEQRVNLNLNFCYYFSLGIPLDSESLMLMTSKSSRYYVSGAFWARDCFLWAFPAILRVDAEMARRMLLEGFTTYLKQGANHALYLNGANLYPGFELDQLVAPIIALERYAKRTGDEGILLRPEIKTGAEYILSVLENWHDEATGLYRTELNPSDDPVALPCLIYNNALVLAALRFCNKRLANTEQKARQLQTALERYATVKAGERTIYAWAAGEGKTPEVYDDPPGSLLLMPYYGWPAKDNKIYSDTLAHYFSDENPYYYKSGLLEGQGCEHAPAPWPMSLCNLLLAGAAGKQQWLDSLRAMPMDNGIACETVYAETGSVKTGAAFATFAGFYANAILEAYENED